MRLKYMTALYDDQLSPLEKVMRLRQEMPLVPTQLIYRQGHQLNRLIAEAVTELIPISTQKLSVPEIKAGVCRRYKITHDELEGRVRDRRLSWPRQEAYWLIKRHTIYSLPRIGRFFAGRDHTTIIHGIRAVNARIIIRPGYHKRVVRLITALNDDHYEPAWRRELIMMKQLSDAWGQIA